MAKEYLAIGTIVAVIFLGMLFINPDLTGFAVFETKNQSTFDEGTYYNTVFNSTGQVILSERNSSELPNNQADDSDGNTGINMSGNVLLLHLNNESEYGENDTHVYDFSGTGNNGTVALSNWDEKGKLGGAFDFYNSDHNDDCYIDLGYDSSICPTEKITVSLWMKVSTFNNGNYYAIGKHAIPGVAGSYAIYGGNGGQFYLRLGDSTVLSPATTVNIQDGDWHHVVGTYDGSYIRLYVDGNEQGSGTSASGSIAYNDSYNLHLGNLNTGGYFNGKIDEVAIWNRSLSAEEIEDLYIWNTVRLNITIRSCDDDSCIDDSWNETYVSSPQDLTVDDNQYFQYKADFYTDSGDLTPELYNVTVDYVLLNSAPNDPIFNNPENNSYQDDQYYALLDSTVTDPDSDGMTVWFYGDGELIDTQNSVSSGSQVTYNWTSLNLGQHNWTVIANDGIENSTIEYNYFNIINLTISCEAGGPYSENALVLVQGNLTNGTDNLTSQTINITIYDSDSNAVGSKEVKTADDGGFETTFSGLSVGSYTANASTTYQSCYKSKTDSFVVGGTASLVLDKVVSLYEISSTNVIYNISLNITNKGGSDATSVTLTDSDSDSSPYDIGTMNAGGTSSTTYSKTYTRNSTTYNRTLSTASLTATDSYTGDSISASSSEIVVAVPATTASTLLTVLKNAYYLSENLTDVSYNLTLTVINSGGSDLTGIDVQDSDLDLDTTIDLTRTESYSAYGVVNISKSTPNGEHTFVKGNATYDSTTYDSNELNILIPGYGTAGALYIVKSATLLETTNDNVTYNVTLSLTNNGGRNLTSVKIYDTDSSSSPYDVGNLNSGDSTMKDYTKTYDRTYYASNQTLVAAVANGTDPIDGLVETSSEEVLVTIPGIRTAASFNLYKTASIEGINSTDIVYNITLNLLNKGGSNATSVLLTDVDSSDSPYNLGTVETGTNVTRYYTKQYSRNLTTCNVTLSAATVNGSDDYTEDTISADSSGLTLSVPGIRTAASFVLDKIATIHNLTNTTITYNVTLVLTNRGGSNATDSNITDTDSNDSPYDLGIIERNSSLERSYLKSFTRQDTATYQLLSVATAEGIDNYTDSLISANSTQLNISIPAKETGPQLTLRKNVYYNNETNTTVNYTVTVEVVNSGGEDITSITFQDSDINRSGVNAIVLDRLNKSENYSVSDYVLVSKAASNTEKLFVKATATVGSTTYESNQLNIIVPGYGGPADLIVYAPTSVTASETLSATITVRNMNEDTGQDFTVTYWIANDGETINFTSGQQTVYVAASGETNLTAELTAPSTAGTYRLRASTMWVGNSVAAYDTFSVTSAEEETTGGGTSGGTVSSFWIETYTISDQEFTDSITKTLPRKERIRFEVNEEYHYVGVIEVGENTVTVNVSSTPQQAILSVGQTKKFDVTDDDYYDIQVTVNSIISNEASITVKSIHEVIPSIPVNITEPEDNVTDDNLLTLLDYAEERIERIENSISDKNLTDIAIEVGKIKEKINQIKSLIENNETERAKTMLSDALDEIASIEDELVSEGIMQKPLFIFDIDTNMLILLVVIIAAVTIISVAYIRRRKSLLEWIGLKR